MLQNIKKLKGDPLETPKKLREKVSQSRNNILKKFLVKGDTRTHVLLLGRPQKSYLFSMLSYKLSVAVSVEATAQLIKLIKSVTSLLQKKPVP